MNPALSNILTIASKALPAGAVGGAITGYFSARLAERAQRTDRLREDHLAELKKEFLSVILARIDHHYAPIAANKVGAIEVGAIRVNRKGLSIAEDRFVRMEHRLQITPIRNKEEPSLVFREPTVRLHSASFDRLFEDAKQRHYQQLAESWLALETDFEKAAKAHLDHAEHIRSELELKLGLPLGDLNSSGAHAKYEELAMFIYEHQLGTHPYHLQVHPDDALRISSSSSHTPYVWCTTGQETKEALATIKAIAEQTARNSTFLTAFELLRPRIEAIRTQVEAAMHDMKLPTKCPFT